jgi:hypothetical protein
MSSKPRKTGGSGGARLADDWGALRFVRTQVTSALVEAPPFKLEHFCKEGSFVPLDYLINPKEPGERIVHLTYYTYRNKLAATATFVMSPRGHIAAVFNAVLCGRKCPLCLPLMPLLLAAAARSLRVAFIFMPSNNNEDGAGGGLTAALGNEDICSEPFTRDEGPYGSVFSPLSPHHHPWLTFGPEEDTDGEHGAVSMRECILQKKKSSRASPRYSLRKMIFYGDNPDGPSTARSSGAA